MRATTKRATCKAKASAPSKTSIIGAGVMSARARPARAPAIQPEMGGGFVRASRPLAANRGVPLVSGRIFGKVFDMAAEFEAHRRQKLVTEAVLLARAKPCEKRCGKDVRWDRLLDGRVDRPAAFA
jgi:hypothetical protein